MAATTEILMAALALGPGLVETREGLSYQGRLQLGEDMILVQSGNAPVAKVNWTQVRHVRFTNTPAPERPVSAPAETLPPAWRSQDIGTVHRSGAASCDTRGVFTLRASGWGAWGPEDSFHYVFRPLAGDGQILARLAKVDESHGKMAACVMIRESLAPDVPMAGATIHPNGEVRLSRRVPRDAPDFVQGEDATSYKWIRLTRHGQRFTAYRSTDGIFWEQVESRTVDMKPDALVGLAAWTLSNTSLGELQMASVQIIPGTPDQTLFANSDGLREGVALRDGSAIAGSIQSFDTNGLKLLCAGREMAFRSDQVARLVFNPPPSDCGRLIGGEGVLLTTGTFIEGKLAGVHRQRDDRSGQFRLRLTINSLLLGLKTFDASRDLILAALADPKPIPAAFHVRTADGSLLRAQSVVIRPSGVVVDGTVLADVVEITRL